MKKLAKILTVALAMLLCVSMVACSSYGKVEKALANIGYEKIESDNTAEKMQSESEVAVTAHLFSNLETVPVKDILKAGVVVVFEFKATEDMKEFYADSETMQGLVKDIKDDGSADEFYNALVEKGLANGNCLVICINPLAFNDVATAIKNA